ncbi:MAG TPA: Ig-like domain-containing protein, partial [Holophagaceae bacterium]|nr:Ig-like domain-containing protein [Holophagaceae bacterium]
FNSAKLADGSHTLTAKAYNTLGATTVSAGVPFIVDNTAPTVGAAESGTSGTLHFTATASDAVGVTKVAFYVDGVLKAADASAPYGSYFNSTTLANGSHSLTAKAYDAAGHVTTSAAVPFSVAN